MADTPEHATSTIVLRVTPSRKAAYVRAARPGTLSAFMLGAADEKADAPSIIQRLQALQRYSVGVGDDGDGYTYDATDESKDGRWVEASDVDEMIEMLKSGRR